MSHLSERLYSYMPYQLQNAIISAFGLYWNGRRFGGCFSSELKKYKDREAFSSDQWVAFQNHELHNILVHAFDNVPYYKNGFTEIGLKRSDLEQFNISEILKLPILSKEHLRQYGVTKLLSKKRDKSGSFFSSSGSSGTPTRIFFSKETHQKWSAAFEARIRNWAGVSRADSRGMIGGRRIVPDGESAGPYHRYNRIEKQIYFSAYHISSKTAAEYALALIKYKPAYMTGYAMSNYFLARFLDEKRIEVPSLKAVITSSEKLTPEMRVLFQKVYKCKTYDSYSGVEACGLISENEYGQLLVSPDVGIIEILNEKGEPCKPGEEGELYCTGLLNYDQPLIRYRIGDRVRLAKDQHTLCGRNMVVIDEIMGRDEDVVRGPDGREMVRFHGLYIDIPGLAAGQLIQHDYDRYTINLQIESGIFNKSVSEKIIYQRLISQLGNVKLNFEYPDKIPPGPNGKFKAVISELTGSGK